MILIDVRTVQQLCASTGTESHTLPAQKCSNARLQTQPSIQEHAQDILFNGD